MFCFCSRMNASASPDLKTDKHGYVRFDCPECPRVAKLQIQLIRARYREDTGMAPIIDLAAPNDCKRGALCGFRVRPS